MDANNYVAPYGSGFIVVVNGQQYPSVGYVFPSQADAENAYNKAGGPTNANKGTNTGTGTTGGSGQTYNTREGPKTEQQIRDQLTSAGYGGPWDINSMLAAFEGAAPAGGSGYPGSVGTSGASVNVGDWQWAQIDQQGKIAQLQDAYNRKRLALDAILGFAAQTGFIDQNMINLFLGEAGVEGSAATYNTGNGTKTVQQMRDELFQASGGMDYWKTADDQAVLAEYGKVTGQPVSEATGPGSAPGSGQLTFGGAAQAAHGWKLGDTLGQLGLQPESIPTYGSVQGKNPTLAMQEIMGNPAALAQTLMMTGMTPEEVATYLENSPMVRSLMEQAGLLQPGSAGVIGQPVTPNIPNLAPLPPTTGTINQPNVVIGQPVGPGVPLNPLDQPGSANWTPGQGTPYYGGNPDYLSGGSGTSNPYNQQTGFQFIAGNKLPVRDTLHNINTQNPIMQTYMGLADFAGYDPNNWLQEFQNILPKGSKNPMTRFM